ncbi:MAG: RdgB/HAM1 family non-canonical purine NTP pyrophosphatase [Acidimicrobiia bacterium]|nr:RdgB/HAM1 family non-canonical purine NTP pyrophosphatase [Acidimicrobiia bacterium]
MIEVVCASANAHKVAEMVPILAEVGVRLLPRPSEVPDVDETGTTLEANARLKARALALATGWPALSDDTGLEVVALGGAPGVRSARYAGERATAAENMGKLLETLARMQARTATERRARFRTVCMVCWPDGRELSAEGIVNGWIGHAPLGDGDFGYDPVFVPDEGDGRTFAQMTAEAKNAISHRGRALRALAAQLAAPADRPAAPQ